MAIEVGVQATKARLSELLAAARAGEDVIITRHGKPDVRLAPVAAPARRQLGFLKVPPLPDGFDAPLAPDELALWE
ncbi:MAG: type II toxin-antitoxin system prevent-host-death family antitoxin [Bifidobacteriaceae bacterium]|jgi:prevent-host-death family protein|nr:type II toxin-antitoxin system prevent-host-death family antitoxin [Bifidobacteriaceae bacterium]